LSVSLRGTAREEVPRTMIRRATLLLAMLVAGCGGGDAASPAGGPGGPLDDAGSLGDGGVGSPGGRDGATASGALPCAVDDVLARSCRSCHGAPPAFGAPMPLVTYDDLHAPAHTDPSRAVFSLVGARIHDDAHPMPQPPNPRLSSADTATLDAWIAAGAPAGAACAAGADAGAADGGVGLSCTPDMHVAPAAPYALPGGVDEAYVCYGFEANPGSKRHLIGFAPRIDDTAVVHHVTLLESDTPVSPTPAPCDQMGTASTSWRPVYGWAPGVGSFALPPEAGFPEDATTHFVVQVHYANPSQAAGHTDASGFDVCTTAELRPNDADIMAFGTTSFTIQPHSTLDLSCSITVPYYGETTHLFAALPHMHKLGRSISSVALPGGTGAPVDLGTVPTWSFGSQAWLPVSDVLQPNDVVQTHCSWQNPGDVAVSFGELTADEMCFSFVMYYPKITDPQWSWALPALYSTCQ
jgi:hypothetical protein